MNSRFFSFALGAFAFFRAFFSSCFRALFFASRSQARKHESAKARKKRRRPLLDSRESQLSLLNNEGSIDSPLQTIVESQSKIANVTSNSKPNSKSFQIPSKWLFCRLTVQPRRSACWGLLDFSPCQHIYK